MFGPWTREKRDRQERSRRSVRYTDLSTGAAQIAAVESEDWNLVQANLNKFSYFTMPPWGALTTAVALNTQIFPTNNTDFRLAIVHAINYTDITTKVFFGQASPMVGPGFFRVEAILRSGEFITIQPTGPDSRAAVPERIQNHQSPDARL